MNEWELIEYIKGEFNSKVELSIGDDSAVIKNGDKYLVFTKDLMVEKTHFILENYPLNFIGEKLVNANLSDVAAIGATPLFALLGLCLKEEIKEKDIKLLLNGIREKLKQYNVLLLGGDIVKGENLSLSMTIIGETRRYITRDRAKENDIIYLSGEIGYSRAGLYEFIKKGDIKNKNARDRFLRGNNRLDLMSFLKQVRVDALIDISDGFYQDLTHILKSSSVGAVIHLENFPKDSYLEKIANESGLNYYDFILNSGEEYELIVVAPEDDEKFLNNGFIKVGKIKKEKGLKFFLNEENINIKNLSFTHNF